MTVVETVVHQCETGQQSMGTPFSRTLTTPEESYERTMRIGEQPVPLDWGWVGESGCGMLVLTNVGRNAVVACYDGWGVVVVPAGESARFQPHPNSLSRWTIHTTGGAGLLKVFAVPS